jgi:hypothetical protein
MQELEILAIEQGTTPNGLIRRLVTEHLDRYGRTSETRHDVHLPLIPVGETGSIQPLTGSDLDETFAGEDRAS